MVSETKMAVFGLSTSPAQEASAQQQAEVKSSRTATRFIFDLIASLTVLYFYTIFYVIPHFLITRTFHFIHATLSRFTTFEQCKGCIGTKSEQIWTQKLKPVVASVQEKVTASRFYPLVKDKVVLAHEKLVEPLIELVLRVAKEAYARLAAIYQSKITKALECVNWSVNNLTEAKQQLVELKVCKQTEQFVRNVVIARAVSIWNTQLLVLMTVAKQAIMGKLNKKVTIVQQEAAPAEAPQAAPQEAEAAPAAPVAEETSAQLPVARKLDFQETTEAVAPQEVVATPAAPQEVAPVAAPETVAPAVEEQKAEEPLLQPAPEAQAPATTTEEHSEEQHQAHQQQQLAGASPRKNSKKNKNKK